MSHSFLMTAITQTQHCIGEKLVIVDEQTGITYSVSSGSGNRTVAA